MGVASYRGATGEEGAATRGLVAAGNSFVAVSEHLQRAQDEFDLTQAEDRFNHYQEKLNQIATDPEKGWKTASGENVLKPEFAKKYADQFEEERKRLLDTLGTQNAKERFNRLAASASMRHRAALYAGGRSPTGLADEQRWVEAGLRNVVVVRPRSFEPGLVALLQSHGFRRDLGPATP